MTKTTKPRAAAKAIARARKPSKPGKGATRATKAAPKAPKRANREEQVLTLLRRPQGVAIAELVAVFGVQAHSARAMVSVFGRKAGGVERRDGRHYLKR